jgi:ketosteroid isomerase-like protein
MSEESTTPDLVERVRAIWDAADRADLDAILEFFAPDAVWEMREGGTFEGVDAIRALFEDYFRAYADFEAQAEEIANVGNGIILAVNLQKPRLLGGARHVQTREAFVYEWGGDVVVRVTMHADVDEGHAAAQPLAEERA